MVARKAPARKRDDVTVAQKRDNDDTPPKSPGSPDCFKGKKRGPGRGFKVPDLTKAMKVVAKQGGGARIDLMPDGRITIIPAGQAPATPADKNSWDEVYAADENRSA
jgi:hypothetical protein